MPFDNPAFADAQAAVERELHLYQMELQGCQSQHPSRSDHQQVHGRSESRQPEQTRYRAETA